MNDTRSINDEEMIEAKVRYVTFRSNDSDFAICSMDRLDRKEAITALGPLKQFHPGDRLSLLGRFETHGKYGLQFKVQMASAIAPKDEEAIREYLINAKLKGIGPKRIDKLLDHYGDQTLNVIAEEPEKLRELNGFGESKIQALKQLVKDQNQRQEVMLFLYELKLSAMLAARIWANYQENSRRLIEENPYSLIDEIDFFTFEIADAVAQRLGWQGDRIERSEAALHHQLNRAYEDGHVCLPKDILLSNTGQQIGSLERAETALQKQCLAGYLCKKVYDEQVFIYRSDMNGLEQEIAQKIKVRVAQNCKSLSYNVDEIEADCEIELAEAQAQALKQASQNNMLLLTGGPGTGKTTTVKALLSMFKRHELDVQLAAPTGRAAKRLSETTKQEAKTIHRLLDYQPQEENFRRGPEQPLECDVVLIDEMSMVDIFLFIALIRALPAQVRLILVGDANQLPSVGPGRIYHDLLISEQVPKVTLEHIFRQAQESQIIVNAYKILKGLPLVSAPIEPLPDFFEIPARNSEHAALLIEQLVGERIPDRFEIKPKDIQIITPMYRGHCGADQLNIKLQKLLNPKGKAINNQMGLRVGDRVMQLKNFYDKDVYNGDMGIIITRYEGGVVVDFGGRIVNYTKENLHMLTLAYACSIHKSQGSEYPAVIIPVVEEHWSMLQRDLLYTAVTRGQRLVILITTPHALHRAVMNQASHQRYTLLAARLTELTSEVNYQ